MNLCVQLARYVCCVKELYILAEFDSKQVCLWNLRNSEFCLLWFPALLLFLVSLNVLFEEKLLPVWKISPSILCIEIWYWEYSLCASAQWCDAVWASHSPVPVNSIGPNAAIIRYFSNFIISPANIQLMVSFCFILFALLPLRPWKKWPLYLMCSLLAYCLLFSLYQEFRMHFLCRICRAISQNFV